MRPPASAPPAPAKTTNPVTAALPVEVSTSQGIATVITTLPVKDSAFATTSARRRCRVTAAGAVTGASGLATSQR
jgi:hypothetical protein